ncbi:MAG: flagellar biosynthesis protein FlhF [Venatoribacter sp.]
MKVKRFTAKNMQAVLRLISEELGDDAVIISTNKTSQGLEVVAAIDYREDASQQEIDKQLRLQDELEQAKQQLLGGGVNKPAPQFDVSNKAAISATLTQLKQPAQASANALEQPLYNHALEQVKGELKDLKEWMSNQTGNPWEVQRPMTWLQTQIRARCSDLGLEPAWIDHLAGQIKQEEIESAWEEAKSLIMQDLPIAQNKLLEQGGMYALVGPTGAGKTTTIGKMAAQFVMRHGADSVALVTLDNYRVAAHDQLRSFSRILGVELHVVTQNGDLNKVLSGLKAKKLVLVDSAGLASQDRHFGIQLRMLKNVGPSLKKLLVLPLTNQSRCLQENYELFKSAGLTGCIFTKLDECFSLGAAMSVSTLTQLPLCLITDGPHIPDDIHYPEAAKLVKLAEQMARMARTRWQPASRFTGNQRVAGL